MHRWNVVIYAVNTLALLCLLLAWLQLVSPEICVPIAGGLIIVVAVLLGCRKRSRLKRTRFRESRRINQESVARIERDWSAVPLVAVVVPENQRSLSDDLNVFGHASLFHLLCTATTRRGADKLATWLLSPSDVDGIAVRQNAVAELAPELEYRQLLEAELRLLKRSRFDEDDFSNWLHAPYLLRHRPLLTWLMRVPSLVAVSSLLFVLTGLFPQEIGLPVMVAALVVNGIITTFAVGAIHDIFRTVSPDPGSFGLSSLKEIFHRLTRINGKSGLVTAIRQQAKQAHRELESLNRIMRPAAISRSPVTTIPVYFPLQIFLLWDFQILHALEAWKHRNGQRFQQWLESLGQYEAIASMAALAYRNPGWSFPRFDSSTEKLTATGIGHPLIAHTSRVTNDVEIGRDKMLLITGSNMSGKSTLLRSIGVNSLLASAGSVVCAKEFQLPPVAVVSSVRTTDALEDGVSLFMAEVSRLKMIVDTAREHTGADVHTLLFLLDEILHGTNTAERHIATQRVLGHLLQYRTLGAVTTHDLHLADDRKIAEACNIVHFRESLTIADGSPGMTFDYVMRPGLAPTTNALKLLDMVGL